MLTNTELIKKLNKLNITQKSSDWCEDIPEDLYEQYLIDCKVVKDNLHINKHRWYATCCCVIKTKNNEYIGVNYLCDSYSEQQEISDCYHTLEFHEIEVKEVTTIEYKLIKNVYNTI